MTRETFESFAQNGEDVVLWRALAGVPSGRYVEVGANDPVVDSVSWPFYQRGWRGITVEPVAALAAAHRDRRPGDVQVEAVVGDLGTDTVTFHEIAATGLSTVDAEVAADHRTEGWDVVDREVAVRRLDDVLAEHVPAGEPIHFLLVDVEGLEASVLATLDLGRFRPWVLVVEATAPNSARPTHDAWEPAVLAAGYELRLFDGLSRFYVAAEHRDELGPALSYPACVLDHFTTLGHRNELARLAAERDVARAELAAALHEGEVARAGRERAVADLVRWRNAAVDGWAHAGGGPTNASEQVAAAELARVRETLSWRVTRPLRSVRSRAGALRR